jgi:hypothetical protein
MISRLVHKILKYRVLIITIITILWSVIMPSQFQKGGVSEKLNLSILLFIIVLGFLYIVGSQELYLLEKLVLPFLFFIPSLIISGKLINNILSKLYGSEYEFILCKSKPAIVANLFFYFICVFLLIILLKAYELTRKKYNK